MDALSRAIEMVEGLDNLRREEYVLSVYVDPKQVHCIRDFFLQISKGKTIKTRGIPKSEGHIYGPWVRTSVVISDINFFSLWEIEDFTKAFPDLELPEFETTEKPKKGVEKGEHVTVS